MVEPLHSSELPGLFRGLERYDLVVIGVSGGADSLCLMHLLSDWARGLGDDAPELLAVTIDHQLRATSGTEAAEVAARAAGLGIPHRTLTWEGDKPRSGLQAEARAARYRLLEEAARGNGRAAVAVAHTQDDQAETLIMRLKRGSGVDGLSAMPRVRPLGDGVDLVRPFLSLSRARIEATLVSRGITWMSDPSNDNPAFERVRVRAAIGRAFEDLGLSAEVVALSAQRLGRARAALQHMTQAFIASEVSFQEGAFASLSRDAFLALPEDLRVRVLERLLWAFGDRQEPALLAQVERLGAELSGGAPRRASLGGALISMGEQSIRIYREAGRLAGARVLLRPGSEVVWDGRFQVSAGSGGAGAEAFEVGALGHASPGEGAGRSVDATLADAGLALPAFAERWPRRALATLPAVWAASRLIAVPHFSRAGETKTEFRVKFLGLEG